MDKNRILEKFKNHEIEQFGKFYKITPNNNETNTYKDKKLILVTSINPTPSGEGKTTTLIGLNDSLNFFNESSVACLRQPSMGPFFGIKGGATGSGECEIQNPQLINCGFTGDFYEIEAANNLILAVLENEIYFNSELDIDSNNIYWKRCIDVNDRSLRSVNYDVSKTDRVNTFFTITAASSLMALFCLAKDRQDFINRLNETIVALNKKGNPIKIKDLEITDSLMLILDKALKPNLAFSKHNNPIIIHGGPFANIAHGCNSIISTKMGLDNFEYILTEAGFGADLGAEKFLNIKCKEANLIPSLVVIAVTLKSVKHHCNIETKDNYEVISKGFENVIKHIESIKSFNLNFCIVINKFSDDDKDELMYLKSLCDNHCPTEISTMWQNGPKDSENIYKLIKSNVKNNNSITYTYDTKDDVYTKIEKICKTIYGAKEVKYSDLVKKKIENNKNFIENYYVCNAKNQYSLTSDQTILGYPKDFTIEVFDIEFNHAAKFIIPIMSKIFLMPGLPKKPNAKIIKYESKW